MCVSTCKFVNVLLIIRVGGYVRMFLASGGKLDLIGGEGMIFVFGAANDANEFAMVDGSCDDDNEGDSDDGSVLYSK